MEEQLISFKTPQLAKEKGFNEVCIRLYGSGVKMIDMKGVRNSDFTEKHQEGWACRPTQALLQKWLREKHGVYIDTEAIGDDKEFPRYSAMVYTCGQDRIDYELNMLGLGEKQMKEIKYDTYEEALEVGLLNALKLVKK